MLNVKSIKKEFPVFSLYPRLVYLDSAATSLKPKAVILKTAEYYGEYPANILRGIYRMSERATSEYEAARGAVAEFLGAASPKEIIFTRNTTESINLLALSLGRQIIKKGDEIVISIAEHHSNFVPWLQLAKEKGAVLKIIDVDAAGSLKWKDGFFTKQTKILSLSHVSNVLGVINPIVDVIRAAKAENEGVVSIVDAAQSAPHLGINVKKLECDFLVFSAHKMLGPTGVGVIWGREAMLKEMPPLFYGGGMVNNVSSKKIQVKDIPYKFEAGTPNIAGVIAFKEALNFLSNLGMGNVRRHVAEITDYAVKSLESEFKNEIKIFGPRRADRSAGIVSFVIKDLHPHDTASLLDGSNICVRAGHHCAMPLHKKLSVSGTVRASFYVYNDKNDVKKLIQGLKNACNILH